MKKPEKKPANDKRLTLKREAVLELKTALKAGAVRRTSTEEGGGFY
jgi:hypothetical protein